MPKFKKHLKGEYSKEDKAKRALADQNLTEYKGVNTTPPAFLSDLAKDIFKSTIEATKEENLKQIDLPLLATFSQTYANIIDASKHLNAEGLVVDNKINPYERILTKEIRILRSLADQLGFSPNSRARLELSLAKHDKPENDPFKELLSDDS